MLFNSTEFAVFLILVLLLHSGLTTWRGAETGKPFLLLASYVFYVSWNPFFGLLLLFSTVLDFTLGHLLMRVDHPFGRRMLLTTSIVANLGLLGFFKYGSFFSSNVLAAAGMEESAPLRHFFDVALPVGISFYTFQTMSYTIEVYRRTRRATRRLLDFALYVAFFPQLVAGPIVRPAELLSQLARPRRARAADFQVGLMRIATGLLKKVIFADTLGTLVDPCFRNPDAFGWPVLLLAVYAYAYQIYFDFSGYSDIAIGLAHLFGIRLPENFDRPYLAANPREFWQRWHITLSTWLRDYLYIPLGGNRRGGTRTHANLLITMILGGLWHGAGWHFIAWGAYHGALLAAHRLVFGRREAGRERVPRALRQLVTFHLVCFGWILFRATSLEQAGHYLAAFGPGPVRLSKEVLLAAGLLATAAAFHTLTSRTGLRQKLLAAPGWFQGAVYALISIGLFFFSSNGQRFIYFQF